MAASHNMTKTSLLACTHINESISQSYYSLASSLISA